MEFTTIGDALGDAGFSPQEVADELTRARDGKSFSVSMLYSCYGGYRRWKPWTVPVLAALLQRRLPHLKITIKEVERLTNMTREQVVAAKQEALDRAEGALGVEMTP